MERQQCEIGIGLGGIERNLLLNKAVFILNGKRMNQYETSLGDQQVHLESLKVLQEAKDAFDE